MTRLFQLAPPHQLAVTWQNADRTQTIYITEDPSLNAITLSLVNALGNAVTFPAGKPGPADQLPEGQSAVYLFPNGLISNADVESAVMAADGWTAGTFTDPGTGFAYIGAAPDSTVTLPDGAALSFVLTRLLAQSRSTSGNVTVLIAGASGLTADQADIPVYVNVANPPDPASKSLDLLVSWEEGDEVFTGADQENDLLLVLTNPGRAPLVAGGASTWGPSPPTFQLTLVYGTGQGALTDPDSAQAISFDLADDYGNAWKPTSRDKQGVFPTWTMQPERDGGGTVLGTGENASVSFRLSGVVTTLPQGVTLAYVSYVGIPGYNDGFFAVELVKVDPIVLKSFTATFASDGPYRTGPADVTLSFEIENASYVTIVGTDYAKRATRADFADTVQVSLDRTASFTLLAYNSKTGQQIARPLTVELPSPPVVIDFFRTRQGRIVNPPNQQVVPQGGLELQVRNATWVAIPGTGYARAVDKEVFHDWVNVDDFLTARTYSLIAINELTGQHASASCRLDITPDPLRAKSLTGQVTIQPDGTPTAPWGAYGWEVAKGGDAGQILLTFGPGTFNGPEPPTLALTALSASDKFGTAAVYQGAWQHDGSVSFSIGLQADQPAKAPMGFYFLAFQQEAYVSQ